MGGEQSDEGGRRKTARIGGLVVKIRYLKDLKTESNITDR